MELRPWKWGSSKKKIDLPDTVEQTVEQAKQENLEKYTESLQFVNDFLKQKIYNKIKDEKNFSFKIEDLNLTVESKERSTKQQKSKENSYMLNDFAELAIANPGLFKEELGKEKITFDIKKHYGLADMPDYQTGFLVTFKSISPAPDPATT
ncbi:MAG: hypothetical protein WCO35_03280 [Candidatus Nomurabacteria bacterium]